MNEIVFKIFKNNVSCNSLLIVYNYNSVLAHQSNNFDLAFLHMAQNVLTPSSLYGICMHGKLSLSGHRPILSDNPHNDFDHVPVPTWNHHLSVFILDKLYSLISRKPLEKSPEIGENLIYLLHAYRELITSVLKRCI